MSHGRRRATRPHGKDANHDAIADALRACGYLVQSLAMVGAGVPDMLVGRESRKLVRNAGRIECNVERDFVLLEIKDGSKKPSERKLTPLEEVWHAAFKGWPVFTVENAAQAIAAVEGA